MIKNHDELAIDRNCSNSETLALDAAAAWLVLVSGRRSSVDSSIGTGCCCWGGNGGNSALKIDFKTCLKNFNY